MKKSFKDFVLQDVGKVFHNENEFADIHIWRGGSSQSPQEVVMIVEDDEMNKTANLEKEHSLVTKDVFFSDKTIRVQVGLIRKPRNGIHVWLDDKPYDVVHSDEDMGELIIKLRANEV